MDTRNMLLTFARAVVLLSGLDNTQAAQLKDAQATIATDEAAISARDAQVADLQAKVADDAAKLAEADGLVASLKGQMCTAVFSADDHAVIDNALALALAATPAGAGNGELGILNSKLGSAAAPVVPPVEVPPAPGEVAGNVASAEGENTQVPGANAAPDVAADVALPTGLPVEVLPGSPVATPPPGGWPQSVETRAETPSTGSGHDTISGGETASENTNAETASVAVEASGDRAGS